MWGIFEAFKVADQRTREVQHFLVINIFCNSQTTINNLRDCHNSRGQALKMQIYQKTKRLVEQRHNISIRLMLGNSKVEGNERTDRAAKKAAVRGKVQTSK